MTETTDINDASAYTPRREAAAQALSKLKVDPALGLAAPEARERLARQGPNDIPEAKSHPLLQFASKFWGLSAWMIELIAVLSAILGKEADFLIALALLIVNAVLSFLQEERASAAVTSLRRQLQILARVLRDGQWGAVPARELVAGDIIRLRSGDFVPADAQIVDGDLQIDQSALTGESRELRKAANDVLYSGSVVRHGEATAVVTATGIVTYFGRTTQLVASAHPKLHVEEVTTRVVRWLFLIVSILVAVTVAVSLVKGVSLIAVLPLSLVLLMSAVPIALPVMFTVSTAIGSMELARRGVLVTRLSATEDAATMDVVCADKTGTLTLNRLSLHGTLPQPGFTDTDVVRIGALASNEADQDAIDLAFLREARERRVLDGSDRTISFAPFSADTRRTEAVIEIDGKRLHVMKGALRTVAAACGLDSNAIASLETAASDSLRHGFRVLAVAQAETDGPLTLVGLALLYDAPRTDSRQLIDDLRSLGVRVKMVTGDALRVASELARELGIGEIVRAPDLRAAQGTAASSAMVEASSSFAEIFPEDKFLVVKSLHAAGHVVGMTGDGVNDAPALRQAEVGIAVSGATDVAKGAASVVLTTEGLGGIIDLVKNGRAVYQRILTWIVNKVSRTILKAGFVVVAFLVTGQFTISALGMVLLVFMTDFVKIALSTDNVVPSQKPENWKIGPLVTLAVVLGVLMLVEALGLLAFGWQRFDLGAHPGRLQTFTFQTLLYFALFSIVSIRERRHFWASWPSGIFGAALLVDAALGIAIGRLGLAELHPLPIQQTLLIVGVAGVCSLGVNDILKAAYLGRMGGFAKGH